ncbi:hypothetical protein WN944_010456 [Citrus x changshan-huyou]|uniref:Uncharacterized protein n=1 Tax=Citrus x changshan-huyou TaxID=2935761 RepID=A0AAP0QSX1_9ROSI
MALNTRWPIGWYSDDEGERLENINDEQHQIEGYSSENVKDNLYGITEHETSKDVATIPSSIEVDFGNISSLMERTTKS